MNISLEKNSKESFAGSHTAIGSIWMPEHMFGNPDLMGDGGFFTTGMTSQRYIQGIYRGGLLAEMQRDG